MRVETKKQTYVAQGRRGSSPRVPLPFVPGSGEMTHEPKPKRSDVVQGAQLDTHTYIHSPPTYTYTYIYIYVHKSICLVYMSMCVCIKKNIYIYIYTYTHTCLCVWVHVYPHLSLSLPVSLPQYALGCVCWCCCWQPGCWSGPPRLCSSCRLTAQTPRPRSATGAQG